jgi:hypothetical protein
LFELRAKLFFAARRLLMHSHQPQLAQLLRRRELVCVRRAPPKSRLLHYLLSELGGWLELRAKLFCAARSVLMNSRQPQLAQLGILRGMRHLERALRRPPIGPPVSIRGLSGVAVVPLAARRPIRNVAGAMIECQLRRSDARDEGIACAPSRGRHVTRLAAVPSPDLRIFVKDKVALGRDPYVDGHTPHERMEARGELARARSLLRGMSFEQAIRFRDQRVARYCQPTGPLASMG